MGIQIIQVTFRNTKYTSLKPQNTFRWRELHNIQLFDCFASAVTHYCYSLVDNDQTLLLQVWVPVILNHSEFPYMCYD